MIEEKRKNHNSSDPCELPKCRRYPFPVRSFGEVFGDVFVVFRQQNYGHETDDEHEIARDVVIEDIQQVEPVSIGKNQTYTESYEYEDECEHLCLYLCIDVMYNACKTLIQAHGRINSEEKYCCKKECRDERSDTSERSK